MKKLLVVLLSLGLIAAFSMTASAADVKFSGQYYVNGVYESNRSLSDAGYSKAYFWTRTRVQTVFQVAEGLSFTTRFDALEKQWGNANRSSSTTEDKSNSGKINVTGTTANAALQENIEMEQAYVTFKTAAGVFDVGYQDADTWGTVFGDTPGSRPRIKFTTAFGPITVLAIYEKVFEADTLMGTATPSGLVDRDADNYALAAIYSWKGGEAGLLYKYVLNAMGRNSLETSSSRVKMHAFAPYMKATFGPIYVEGEVIQYAGKKTQWDTTGSDLKAKGFGAYFLAKANIGPAYVGAQVGFSSGDVDSTDDTDKTGPSSSTSWTPALIFGNANLTSWTYGSQIGGGLGTGTGTYSSSTKNNLVLYNIFGGFNPTPKLNIQAAISVMSADKLPTSTGTPSGVEYVSKKYGTEADIMATYKIYDNLTYMVGAGYLWTGDYFKGTADTNKVGNDYLVMNQLTLNF